MLESTVRQLIAESNRARNAIAWWLVCFVAAGLSIAFGWGKYGGLNEFRMAASLLFFALGSLLMVLNAFRYARINAMFHDDEEEPPANDISNMLNFQQEQHITQGRIERREGNTVHLGRIGLSSNEWRRLAVTLSQANWKWTRKLLTKTHIWEGLTVKEGTHTRYEIVTSEFERLQAVKVKRNDNGQIISAKVTNNGRTEICRLAGTALL